jgi:Membrane bound beta barrel domain (DUF5777)
MTRIIRLLLTPLVTVAVIGAAPASGQTHPPSATNATSRVSPSQAPTAASDPANGATAATQAQDDPDLDPNPAQPDFTLATLPTNLRLPVRKMSFRLTHRFGRPLGAGDFGDLVGDLFGLDSGAVIGLDFRYGLIRGGQIGVYRTSNRTIQFYGQYELTSQKTFPVGISVVANIDGTDNFQDSYSPGLSAVISREVSDRAALYLEPAWVNNSNPEPTELVDDNDTFVMGLGARLRLLRNTYVFVEGSPRLAGYAPGDALISFGIEQRVGGHMFQLNFSNGLGTTLAQVARGGSSSSDWYLGFNLSRKFY